jgi:putative toxin-antitoxin system antitoxin component (TIGR02293 family)
MMAATLKTSKKRLRSWQDFFQSPVMEQQTALLEGLPTVWYFAAFPQFDLTTPEMLSVLQMSPSTMARRRLSKRFTPEESDRVYRFMRLRELIVALFQGDTQQATHWIKAPTVAFGGATPLEMMRTDIGAREVERLIGRLQHGVFS